MAGLLCLALVVLVCWYAWPAATTWKAKAMAVVLAFWLPILSWPWLLWYGHRARRARAAEIAQEAQAQRRQEWAERASWWLGDFEGALVDGDLRRAELANDVLVSMELGDTWRGIRHRELQSGLAVLAAPVHAFSALFDGPAYRENGTRRRTSVIAGKRVSMEEGAWLATLHNGRVSVRVPTA